MSKQSTQQTAIVTGAGGDIGRAICIELAKDGFAVLALDIAKAPNDETIRLVHEAGGTGEALICDILDANDRAKMVEAGRELGAISLLVNNVGAITAESLQQATVENFEQDFKINQLGAFACFKAIEKDLIENKGVLTNIASVNGLGVFGHPGYSAAKASLLHFTRLVAVEYGKFGIRANAIAPGTVRTQAWDERAKKNPQVFEDAKRWYPLQRVADPVDIAKVVSFISSPAAAAISGVCLPVDCGLTAGQAELAGTFAQSEDY
ncbi:SDR family oxidoreductase [Maritalea mediterranea]|uniref:SDR family oxidoreductase n=1 Tax=Maritalea mediterranea TaxID=2909667 RepID=A0ABS9E678_9HYPH|nr:SDR family oxidoreductase [Maritalea mediterranea]